MNKLLSFIALIIISCNSFSQNNVYTITEKIAASDYSYQNATDSVFVTDPLGITTVYSIPYYRRNTKEHDAQFNVILNSITSQGYKIVQTGNWPALDLYAVSNEYRNPLGIIRTLFLAEP